MDAANLVIRTNARRHTLSPVPNLSGPSLVHSRLYLSLTRTLATAQEEAGEQVGGGGAAHLEGFRDYVQEGHRDQQPGGEGDEMDAVAMAPGLEVSNGADAGRRQHGSRQARPECR